MFCPVGSVVSLLFDQPHKEKGVKATNIEEFIHGVVGIPGIQRLGEMSVRCGDGK